MGAGAVEGDSDSVLRADGGVGGGGQGEVVGAEDGAKVLDAEDGLDDGECCSVRGEKYPARADSE